MEIFKLAYNHYRLYVEARPTYMNILTLKLGILKKRTNMSYLYVYIIEKT